MMHQIVRSLGNIFPLTEIIYNIHKRMTTG